MNVINAWSAVFVCFFLQLPYLPPDIFLNICLPTLTPVFIILRFVSF